jgi:hypothetical protein
MEEVRETLYFGGRRRGKKEHYCVRRCSGSSRYSSYNQHDTQDVSIAISGGLK